MITLSKDFNFSLGTEVDEYYRPNKGYRNIHRAKRPAVKPEAVAYLEGRGISQAVTELYEITVQKNDSGILVFPFYDENNVLQFVKYRNTNFAKGETRGSKEWCEPNCKPILFGMNHTEPGNKVLALTEGQIDSLTLAECGIVNAVSVPLGKNGFTWIPYCWDFLQSFETLVIFGDREGDEITLLDEMAVRFHGTTKHIRLDDYLGCKDANEILQKHGKDAVRNAFQNAEPVAVGGVKRLKDVKRISISQLECVTTGFAELDKRIGGFFFGNQVVLTGARGEGKSTLASQFAAFAVDEGHSVLLYSGELAGWSVRKWFEQQIAGDRHLNPMVTKRGFEDYSIDGNCIPAMEEWYGNRVYIYDNASVDDENDGLLEVVRKCIRQNGCRVVIIDNLMTAMADDIASDFYRQQTVFVKQLTKIAKETNALVLLIAHPRKSSGNEFENDDVSGSSNITNLADVVLRYSKPTRREVQDLGECERVLSIHKNRLSGGEGKFRMYYEKSSRRISEDGNFSWWFGWEEPIGDGFHLADEFEQMVFD